MTLSDFERFEFRDGGIEHEVFRQGTGPAVLLMHEPATLAPIVCQPSLPFGVSTKKRAALGLKPEELAAAKDRAAKGLPPLCLRFTGDTISPTERLRPLRAEFGSALQVIEIDSSPGNPHGLPEWAHSTLTVEYKDEPGHPTRLAFERVVAVLGERLR